MTSATDLILYADDDENDAFLVQLAFSKAGVANPLVVVSSGKAAIEYLSVCAEPGRAAYPLPRLVLLDLNMPGKSGLEVLKWIRGTPALSTLVVVMLTSSNQDTDIHRAYLQGANGYLVKPGRIEELVTLAKSIKDFWLTQNRVNLRIPTPRPREEFETPAALPN